MRTTLDIDEDVLEIAKGMAQGRKRSVGKVISELARKGAHTPIQLVNEKGVWVIPRRTEAESFGPADVQRWLDEDDRELLKNYFRKPRAK